MVCEKIRISLIKPLLKTIINGEDMKLRISSEAKDSVCQFLETELDNDIKTLIRILPHKENGELKRITFQEQDFTQSGLVKNPNLKYDKSIYGRISKIKENLKEKDQKLRIDDESKPYFNQFIDQSIEKNIQLMINKLPRKRKGERVGEIKRITFQREDFKK